MEMIEEKRNLNSKLLYIGECAIDYAHLLLPVIYVTCLLPFECYPTLRMLLFWFLIGYICHFCYIAWRKRVIDDEVDYDTMEDEYNPKKRKSIWKEIKQMERWELMHWIPIFGFLGLTWWAMKNGLQLLFPAGTEADVFIYVFSSFITITLLWLILMISLRRNMLGFIVFYILFDALSAFSFNFVHFYDNISKTQRLDSDMKACTTYKDMQSGKIEQTALKVTNLYTQEEATINEEYNKCAEKRESLKQRIEEYRDSASVYASKKWTKTEKKWNDRADKLQNQLDDLGKRTNKYAGIYAVAKEMKDSLSVLNNLCEAYQRAKSPRDFKDLYRTTMVVRGMNPRMNSLVDEAEKMNLVFCQTADNDTIKYILEKIQRTEADRFASLRQLFQTLASFVNHTIADKEQLKIKKKANGNEILLQFYTEEASFEQRLLLLAISLSILIDVLPLALGVFVAIIKRKKK